MASKKRPIIFSNEMVRAILDGRKFQTRRVIKNPQRLEGLMLKGEEANWCPYGVVGDRLWCKEDYKYLIQGDLVITYYKFSIDKNRVIYTPLGCLDEITRKKLIKGRQDVWKSKLLMFKFMARLWLEITGIRVERVQDISEEDAVKEGIDRKLLPCSPYEWFANLWDSINAKRNYGWEVNLPVWVIEFRKVKNDE